MASLISLGQLFDKTISTVEHKAGHFTGIVTWSLVATLSAALAKIIAMYGEIGSFSVADGLAAGLNIVSAIASFVVGLYISARLILANAENNGEPVKDDHQDAWRHALPLLGLYVLSGLCLAFLSLAPLSGAGLYILQSSNILDGGTFLGVLAALLLVPGGVLSGVAIAIFLSSTTTARLRVVLDNDSPLVALKKSLADSQGAKLMLAIRYYLPRLVYSAIVYVLNLIILFLLQYTALILAGIGIPAGFAVGIESALKLLALTATALLGLVFLTTNDYFLARSLKPRR